MHFFALLWSSVVELHSNAFFCITVELHSNAKILAETNDIFLHFCGAVLRVEQLHRNALLWSSTVLRRIAPWSSTELHGAPWPL